MRSYAAVFVALSACVGPGATKLDLTEVCSSLSARVCRCDDGSEGVQLCNDNGTSYVDCDCSLTFSAALCPPDYEPGQEALCVGPAPTCALTVAAFAEGARTFNAADTMIAMSVRTNLDDGDVVVIEVDGVASGQAYVNSGVASFTHVPLGNDGEHRVVARCKTQRGLVTESPAVRVRNDATPPPLTITSPQTNQHFTPSEDSQPMTLGAQLDVCVTTTATDVASYCVAIDGVAASCVAAPGCITIDCPGGAPFTVTARLSDAAENTSTHDVTGVSCSRFVPAVTIVSPGAGTGPDPATHLLAAETAQALHDLDAQASGAQWDVVACTDATAGTAELRAGLVNGTLMAIGSASIALADVADACPVGKGYVARFAHVTLPESTAFYTGALDRATRLEVSVTDLSGERGTSAEVMLWVDSNPPVISGDYDFCGITTNADTLPYTWYGSAIYYTSMEPRPILRVTNSSGVHEYTNPGVTSGFVLNYGAPVFELGPNEVKLVGSELSGNAIRWPNPCTNTITSDFYVYLVKPDTGLFNAAWNGIIGIEADSEDTDVTVEIAIDGVSGGTGPCDPNVTPVWTWQYDPNCRAEITPSIALAEGAHVLSAVVHDGSGDRPDTLFTRNIFVDRSAPPAPSSVAVSVVNRRESRFHLSWPAPEPGLRYEVYSAPRSITGPTGDFFAVTTVSGPTGTMQGVDVPGRMIEVEHTFVIIAKDSVGNTSGVTAVTGRANFNRTLLSPPGPTGQSFGAWMNDGALSINGDAYADLIVATGNANRAYAYFGTPVGFAAAPSVTFSGVPDTFFAQRTRILGDVDGDGLNDVGMGSTLLNEFYVYRGRTSWPTELLTTEADLKVRVDTTAEPDFVNASFGRDCTPVGDMNGDGADDFAVGAFFYNGYQGAVFVILGTIGPQTWPQEIVLPRDIGTRVVALYGNPVSWEQGAFGSYLIGIGPHFAGGAPGIAVASIEWTGADGDLYLFRGGPGFAGSYQYTDAAAHVAGEVPTDNASWYGGNPTLVGPLGGAQAVAVSAPRGGDLNHVLVFAGTEGTGFFARSRQVRLFAALDDTTSGNFRTKWGSVMAGGGVGAHGDYVSFIGDPEPDLMITSYTGVTGPTASPLFLFQGSTLRNAIGGPDLEARAAADVTLWIDPAINWESTYPESGTVIGDLDGDGYGDFAIAEGRFFGAASDGRMLVFW